MGESPKQRPIPDETPVAEQDRLTQNDGDHRYVNRISHVTVEACHHQLLGWRDRRRRAQPLQRKAHERIHKPGYSRDDQKDPDCARQFEAEERRPKLPTRHPPRHEPCQQARRDHEKEGGAQDGSCLLHGRDPFLAILALRTWSAPGPPWVRRRHDRPSARCPFCPRKRTSLSSRLMSALGHKPTSSPLGRVDAGSTRSYHIF